MGFSKHFGVGVAASLLLFNGVAIYSAAMRPVLGALLIPLVICPLGNGFLALLGTLAGRYQKQRDPKFRLRDYMDVLVMLPIVLTVADVIVIFRMDA